MDEVEREIECLRARLISERSNSRIARQMADQLTQRVEELERQLEIVTNQKKKAEKAAAKLLSILQDGDGGIVEYSDDGEAENVYTMVSGECEEEKILTGKNQGADKTEVRSVSRDQNEAKDLEINMSNESTCSSGTLSWTSYDSNFSSSHGSMMKKSQELSVKHQSCNLMLGAGSSPKRRAGKSCRQLRRRDISSAKEQQDTNYSNRDGIMERCLNVMETEIEPLTLETTPEQTSGEENYSKVFPEGAQNIPPVQESIGATELQASLCGQHLSEENMQQKTVESATNSCLSSLVLRQRVHQNGAVGRANTLIVSSVDSENPVAGVGLNPRESNMRGIVKAECNTQPEADENRVGPDGNTSTNITTVPRCQENASGFPRSSMNDYVEANSSGLSAEASSSMLGRSHIPMERTEYAKSDEITDKQPTFYVESPTPSTPDSRSRILSHGSSINTHMPSSGSRSCILNRSPGELGGVLKNLQLAKVAIQSRLDGPPWKDGAIVAATGRAKTAEDGIQLPFISCAGLFRLPPSSYQHATGPSQETPRLHLCMEPISGDLCGHSYPDARRFSSGNMHPRSNAVSSVGFQSSDAFPGFSALPPPDEQYRTFH